MEAEVAQNTNRIAHLNEVREQKELDIATTVQNVGKENNAISQLKYQIQSLDKEITYFESQNLKHQQA